MILLVTVLDLFMCLLQEIVNFTSSIYSFIHSERFIHLLSTRECINVGNKKMSKAQSLTPKEVILGGQKEHRHVAFKMLIQ